MLKGREKLVNAFLKMISIVGVYLYSLLPNVVTLIYSCITLKVEVDEMIRIRPCKYHAYTFTQWYTNVTFEMNSQSVVLTTQHYMLP